MRALLTALAALGVLAECRSGSAPECTYLPPQRSPEYATVNRLADPSQVPMYPYNPYWVSADPSLPVIGSPDDPCAGQPYHPGRFPPPQ